LSKSDKDLDTFERFEKNQNLASQKTFDLVAKLSSGTNSG